MLSEEALERLSERLVNRIEKLNEYFIKKIGNQIYDIGTITPSQLNELLQSVKYGNDIDDIMNKLAEITDKNVKDIYEIFEEVAKKNQNYAKTFYEYSNTKFVPFDENQALKKHVESIAKITADEYVNMSKTIAYTTINNKGVKEFTSLSKTYQNVIDEAILSISQGRETFDTVAKRIMKQLTSNGLRTVDYASGYSRRLDSSVRMNIMDGVRRLNRELQEQFGEEFGADGVEVSHHKNPAPDHENTVDGKQFSKEEYEKINNSLDRHVGELNCYHFIYPIILGVSEPMYSKEQLEADKKANKEGFEFEGTHYTNYQGTQLQRRLETRIRQYKDRQIGAKSINDLEEVYHCQEKIEQLTNKYNKLSKVSGLPTKVDRLRVEGYSKVNKKELLKYNGPVGRNDSSYIAKDIHNTKVSELGYIDEERKRDALEYYEKKIIKKDVENAIIIQRDGKVIRCVGTSEGVGIYGNLKDAIITHNHTSIDGEIGGSFGKDDFMLLSNHLDIRELRAIDEMYDYSMKALKKLTESDYTSAYLSTIPVDKVDFKHLVMEELKKKGLIYYERKIRK